MIEYILPIFCASNAFFWFYLMNIIDPITISAFALGLLHAILPMQKFNEMCFKVKDPEPNTFLYQNVKANFLTDYSRENPATATIAKKVFLETQAIKTLKVFF